MSAVTFNVAEPVPGLFRDTAGPVLLPQAASSTSAAAIQERRPRACMSILLRLSVRVGRMRVAGAPTPWAGGAPAVADREGCASQRISDLAGRPGCRPRTRGTTI